MLASKPYVWGTHNAPHDIEVREFGSGKSRIETARTLGIKFVVVPNLPVDDGIEAVRNLLGRCWFDKEKCKQGIASLIDYHKDYDEKRKMFRSAPAHNWSSHAADAFRYFAVGFKERYIKTVKTQQQSYGDNSWLGL